MVRTIINCLFFYYGNLWGPRMPLSMTPELTQFMEKKTVPYIGKRLLGWQKTDWMQKNRERYTKSSIFARLEACTRLCTPSLLKIWLIWVFTVLTEIC